MIDATFVKELASRFGKAETVDDKLVLPPGHTVYEKPRPQDPKCVTVESLDAFSTYLTSGVDGIEPKELFLSVQSTTVSLYRKLNGPDDDHRRWILLHAAARPSAFKFDTYMKADEFLVGVLANFVASPDRDTLVALASGIKQVDERQYDDDGVTQTVNIKRGLTGLKVVKVPNPVTLAPYRTFREVQQPESLYVVRARDLDGDEPELALFPGDGESWRVSAVDRVKGWLTAACPAGTHIIG